MLERFDASWELSRLGRTVGAVVRKGENEDVASAESKEVV